jgi:hypothetical protein
MGAPSVDSMRASFHAWPRGSGGDGRFHPLTSSLRKGWARDRGREEGVRTGLSQDRRKLAGRMV